MNEYTVQRYFLDANEKWEHIITSTSLHDCKDLAKMLSGVTHNTACRVIDQDNCVVICFKNCEELYINSEDWITKMNSKFTIWLNPDYHNRKLLTTRDDEESAKSFAEIYFQEDTKVGDNIVVIENHANPKDCPTVIFNKTKH